MSLVNVRFKNYFNGNYIDCQEQSAFAEGYDPTKAFKFAQVGLQKGGWVRQHLLSFPSEAAFPCRS